MNLKLLSLLCLVLFVSSSFKQDLPKKATRNRSLKVCVISDLNSSYGSTTYSADVSAVIQELETIRPDIILCAGDMVAGQKASLTDVNIKSMWAGFNQNILAPISRLQIPFGFTVGNHDASPSYKTDREQAKQFWQEHAEETNLTFVDSANYPFYFSYVKNQVFFISWDAAGANLPREVFGWMEEQLESRVARKARLRILLGHLPLYPIVESKNKAGEFLASADSSLLFMKQHGIDLYISGHQHAYYPATKNGLRLLNAGAIGDGPRKILGHSEEPKKAYTVFEVPVRSPKKFTYKTYSPVCNTKIETSSLPDSVVGVNGVIKRDDQ